jgi:Rrf2 family nitric oxide-sensitive transcriptional repressor
MFCGKAATVGEVQLRFARRTDYALRAALELATRAGALRTREQLATAIGAPSGVVAQALADLVRGGIASAVPGRGGGYTLAREPAEITVYDVVAALEPVEPELPRCVLHGGACLSVGPCPFHATVAEARTAFADALRATTLADAARGVGD